MKLFEQVKIALNNLEEKISKTKDSDLVIELICKNDAKPQEKYNIEQINAIGTETTRNDINAVSSMFKA